MERLPEFYSREGDKRERKEKGQFIIAITNATGEDGCIRRWGGTWSGGLTITAGAKTGGETSCEECVNTSMPQIANANSR